MQLGHFYFIKDIFFSKFNSDGLLMKNKESVDGVLTSRPCHYAILEPSTGLYWLIPISSKVAKYKSIYSKKIKDGKRCDTLVFGDVLGHQKAFLIQNMFPITPKYIDTEYINKSTAVQINGVLQNELHSKANKILALHRIGIRLIIPDVSKIEEELLKETATANISIV